MEEPSSSTQPAEDETQYPTGLEFWLAICTLCAILILISLDINIIAVAIPAITDHFHTVADVGWYSSAFRLCACAFQFLFGKAFKLFPMKRVYILANVLSIVGALLCGAAQTSAMLVIGRAVSGAGTAGILAGTFAILVQLMPLRRRPIYVGVLSCIEGIAIVAAPLIGGAITQYLNWRWCFYISPPLGTATLLMSFFCLKDRPKQGEIARMTWKQKVSELDLVSNLLFIPALSSLFLALSWAGVKYPWTSGQIIGPLVAFVILLVGFAYNLFRRGDRAALPPRIMKNRSVIFGAIFISCTNSASNVIQYYLPTYFQVVRGYSPSKSGLLMLPLIIASTVGLLIHGMGTSACGYYAPFMVFASVLMPIGAGLLTTFKVNTSFAELIIYTALAGLSYGIGFSGPQTAVQAVLPTEDIPLGISVMLFAQSMGPAVAVAVAQVIFTNDLGDNVSGLVPGLDQQSIQAKGLTEIAMNVPKRAMEKVLVSVDSSLSTTFYLVVGLACATVIGSLGIEWKSVKEKRS